MSIKEQFHEFIVNKDHPCMMAQSVILDNHLTLNSYRSMYELGSAEELMKDLHQFLQSCSNDENVFESFVAVFTDDQFENERTFERTFWELMETLHDLDPDKWDAEVSSDPSSADFSFSLFGTAFYLVGLHPKSSRKARRFEYPAIVFNLHGQFEKLRKMGAYKTVRDRIRQRDEEKNGSINPMLEDFGESSEAKQYSGRAVEKNWKCPFSKTNEPWNT